MVLRFGSDRSKDTINEVLDKFSSAKDVNAIIAQLKQLHSDVNFVDSARAVTEGVDKESGTNIALAQMAKLADLAKRFPA